MDRPRSQWLDSPVADVVIAVALTVFGWLQLNSFRLYFLFGMRHARAFPGPFNGFIPFQPPTPTPFAYLLVAACFLPLVLRRRYPLGVLAAVTLAAAAFELFPHPAVLTILGPMVGLYTVGTRYDRLRLYIAAAATTVILLVAQLPGPSDRLFLPEFARIVAMLALAAALGAVARNQRAYVAEVERRAEEAELRAEEETARRVDEERLRIARELHDVTAHSLSVIAVQSAAAAHVLDSDPDAARRSLEDIRRTSRESLQELRSVVGSLRGVGETPPLAPTPGLARMADLVRPLDEAGISVDLRTSGDLGTLPPLVDSSAYRIVQEALTNVLRHASGASHVTVHIDVNHELLRITVVDDGRGHGGADEGHGISGMRERAVALGGHFEAGPREGGGWRVSAELPLHREAIA